MYNYIVIEGNIGAGKTSFATRFSEESNARLILEQFEENSFLPKFYEDQAPLKRGCRIEDVMKALLYVIDQEYETGQAVPVTGGQIMLS